MVAHLNSALEKTLYETEGLKIYRGLPLTFVRIHSFADGNGSIARFIANLTVFELRFSPILIY